jgi:hypothetical protein
MAPMTRGEPMSGHRTDTEDPETQSEIDRLRALVDQLEGQLAEVEMWANRAIVEAQEKTYWLDRWHLDLNALMRRPAAYRIRAAGRVTRSVYRAASRLSRRLVS